MRQNLVLCSLLVALILVSFSVQIWGSEDPEKQKHEGEQREEEHEEENSPYVFQDKHFSTIFQTEYGKISQLQRFSERSEKLRGIDNYRLTILEAEPQTFRIPNHFDAEVILFILEGKGSISLIRADSDKRDSFYIKKGGIVRIPSGTPLYLINSDKHEKLVIANLLQPVFTPGDFLSFFGAAVESPQSFYTTFSTDILEAAFNTKRENLERVFGKKVGGAMIKASSAQIVALSHHEKRGIWPFGGGESKGAINILEQSPTHSNQYGKLYEVFANELKDLEDINVKVTYLNLTKNAMAGPTYHSKATMMALVVEGEGYFEMASPHLSSESEGEPQSQGRRKIIYEKVNTRLKKGMLVVIPASHPYLVVASKNRNLEVVSFALNARDSRNYVLAGKGNVASQFEKEARELAFGVSLKDVDEVFGSQEEEIFFPGPSGQHKEGHGGGLMNSKVV